MADRERGFSGLPDWNDLPQEARVAACDAAGGWLDDDACAGDVAHEVYNAIKERTPQQTFPLFAPLGPEGSQS